MSGEQPDTAPPDPERLDMGLRSGAGLGVVVVAVALLALLAVVSLLAL